jgi:hypothetical protein
MTTMNIGFVSSIAEFVRQHLSAAIFAQVSSSYHLLENAEMA